MATPTQSATPAQPATTKRIETIIGSVFAAAFLWLIWGWWSFTGLYRLVAVVTLKVFGSYGVITTFGLSFSIIAVAMLLTFRLLRPKGLFLPNKPISKAEADEKVGIGMSKFMIGVGIVSLIIFLISVAGLVSDSHRNPKVFTLDLSSPSPLPAGTDLVRLVGFSRPELLVGVSTKQTPGVETTSNNFMAVVGPRWQPGEPIPVIVQGSPALGMRQRVVDPEEQPREIKIDLPIAVVRTTTSGFAEYLLERNGARSDAHTLILDTDLNSVRNTLWTTFGISLMVAVACLGIGFFALRAAARQSAARRLQQST